MAIARTPTLLPLDRFATILGLHPLLFNQVEVPETNNDVPANCGLMVQYSWQSSDAIGREELAQYIAEAESDISRYLGYRLLPTWEYEEVLNTRPYRPELWSVHKDIRGYPTANKTRYGHLLYGGARGKTLITANALPIYSDLDGDGYNETATIAVVTSVTDPEEIHLYYPDVAGDDVYEIRPIKVVIAGGSATITCRREQLVREILLEGLGKSGVDGLDDLNFEDEVDVYRVFNDPSTQAQFVWRDWCADQFCSFISDGSSCQNCSLTLQNGCLNISDARLGMISSSPGVYDPNTNTFTGQQFTIGRAPDRVRMWYRAGWRNQHLSTPELQMDYIWERAVARLALSRMDRAICSCDNIQDVVKYWAEDLAMTVATSGRAASSRLSPFMQNCPLGTTRGALYAWGIIFKERLGGV